jgi:hypothetical protein
MGSGVSHGWSGSPRKSALFRHLRDERGIERSRRSFAPDRATNEANLGMFSTGATGLEPATSGVTGRLNGHPCRAVPVKRAVSPLCLSLRPPGSTPCACDPLAAALAAVGPLRRRGRRARYPRRIDLDSPTCLSTGILLGNRRLSSSTFPGTTTFSRWRASLSLLRRPIGPITKPSSV